MTKNISQMKDRELLIRIDERQAGMSKKIANLCDTLSLKVNNDEKYKEMVGKVDNLWDSKNKVIGWLIGSAGIGGIAGALANQIKEVLAR